MDITKVLVTGGAGFIGSHIVKNHLDAGREVWVIDDLSSGSKDNLPNHPKLQVTVEDLTTCKDLDEAVAWADRIYHMAAVVGQKQIIAEPIRTFHTNTYGLERVLKGMSKCMSKAQLLVASSSSVYGHADHPIYKEDAVINVLPGEYIQQAYSVGKLINELTTLSYANTYNLNCLIIRYFNVVGTNQTSRYGMVIPNFVKRALAGNPLEVYGDGTQTRSFGNVKDSLRATEILFDNPKANLEIINIGNDREISILDLAKLVIERTKSSSEIKFVPYLEAYGIDFLEIKRRQPNLEKLRNLTGFTHEYTLEETIDQVIAEHL